MRFNALANKDGTLSWETQGMKFRWLSYCESHPNFPVELSHKKGKRGLGQNSFLWVVYTLIADHCGHSPEEIHRLMKGLYLPPKILKLHGKEYKIAGSSTELNTAQFAEYTERVVSEAASLGIVIPSKAELERASILAL